MTSLYIHGVLPLAILSHSLWNLYKTARWYHWPGETLCGVVVAGLNPGVWMLLVRGEGGGKL